MFRNQKNETNKNNNDSKSVLVLEEKWIILENGIQKLFDFIDSDLKKVFLF
jgi:hypothetical protein